MFTSGSVRLIPGLPSQVFVFHRSVRVLSQCLYTVFIIMSCNVSDTRFIPGLTEVIESLVTLSLPGRSFVVPFPSLRSPKLFSWYTGDYCRRRIYLGNEDEN